MTWPQGGPTDITFQRAAAVVMVMHEARPEQKRPATAKLAGKERGGAWCCLLTLPNMGLRASPLSLTTIPRAGGSFPRFNLHENALAKPSFDGILVLLNNIPPVNIWVEVEAFVCSISDTEMALRIVAPKRRRKRPCTDAKRSSDPHLRIVAVTDAEREICEP